MAEKKFYWLKLRDNFFTQPKIKKLRKIAGGDTYTIIYLKMQLLSLQNEGKLYFEGIEDDFVNELALTLDEDADNVKVTVLYLMAQGLLEEVTKDEYAMVETMSNIGSETAGAARVRQHRQRKAELETLQCNGLVTTCNTEIRDKREENREKRIETDKEIEKDKADAALSASAPKAKKQVQKHRYGEYGHVLLKDSELEKLRADFPNWDELITYLDEYIEMKGYKAKSHYLAIRKWVVNAVKEQKQRQQRQQRQNGMYTLSNGAQTSNPFIAALDDEQGNGDFPF